MTLSTRQSLHSEVAPSRSVDWEETDCPLCGSEDYAPYLEAPDLSQEAGLRFLVVQCPRCLLCFTNPRPSAISMAQFYQEDYKPFLRQKAKVSGAASRWRHLLSLRHDRQLRDVLPLHGQGRLLDFGCGEGSFLLRMRAGGWSVTGLDSSHSALECLRTEGIPGIHGTLPHPDLPPHSFDMITMWHSLEHVHQPLETLRAAHDLLAPGGKILVAAPNIASLPFRWFGSAWNGLDLPRHLTHFSPATLRMMLESAGFRTGRVCMARGSSWIRHSAQRARQMRSGSSLRLGWLSTRIGSNLASWYAYLSGMSDRMMILGMRS